MDCKEDEEFDLLDDFNEYYQLEFERFERWSSFRFSKFKRIVKENYKLMNSDDIDFYAVKRICCPEVRNMSAVGAICFIHNKTYFTDEILSWADLLQNPDSVSFQSLCFSLRPRF